MAGLMVVCCGREWYDLRPITSIRRALTNLCNTGRIIKSGQVPGQYGRPINVYKAVT